jgi:hypothetical protein
LKIAWVHFGVNQSSSLFNYTNLCFQLPGAEAKLWYIDVNNLILPTHMPSESIWGIDQWMRIGALDLIKMQFSKFDLHHEE